MDWLLPTIAAMGFAMCMWMFAARLRTFLGLRAAGINGRYRALAVLRVTRVLLLSGVFLLLAIAGVFAMATMDAVPTIAIVLMEFLLFIKLATEEFLEGAINNMQDMKDAAKSQSATHLDC